MIRRPSNIPVLSAAALLCSLAVGAGAAPSTPGQVAIPVAEYEALLKRAEGPRWTTGKAQHDLTVTDDKTLQLSLTLEGELSGSGPALVPVRSTAGFHGLQVELDGKPADWIPAGGGAGSVLCETGGSHRITLRGYRALQTESGGRRRLDLDVELAPLSRLSLGLPAPAGAVECSGGILESRAGEKLTRFLLFPTERVRLAWGAKEAAVDSEAINLDGLFVVEEGFTSCRVWITLGRVGALTFWIPEGWSLESLRSGPDGRETRHRTLSRRGHRWSRLVTTLLDGDPAVQQYELVLKLPRSPMEEQVVLELPEFPDRDFRGRLAWAVSSGLDCAGTPMGGLNPIGSELLSPEMRPLGGARLKAQYRYSGGEGRVVVTLPAADPRSLVAEETADLTVRSLFAADGSPLSWLHYSFGNSRARIIEFEMPPGHSIAAAFQDGRPRRMGLKSGRLAVLAGPSEGGFRSSLELLVTHGLPQSASGPVLQIPTATVKVRSLLWQVESPPGTQLGWNTTLEREDPTRYPDGVLPTSSGVAAQLAPPRGGGEKIFRSAMKEPAGAVRLEAWGLTRSWNRAVETGLFLLALFLPLISLCRRPDLRSAFLALLPALLGVLLFWSQLESPLRPLLAGLAVAVAVSIMKRVLIVPQG